MHFRTEIIGRIGKDAVTSKVDNGGQVINFPICYSKKFTRSDGTAGEEVTWIECSYWRSPSQSTSVAQFLTKGKMLFLEGQISTSLFTDLKGEPRAILRLRIEKIVFTGGEAQ